LRPACAACCPLTLSNIAKAYAKLGYHPAEGFLALLSRTSVARMGEFGMAEVANLLWACAQLGHRDEELFAAAEVHVWDNLNACSWHHIGSVVASLRDAGYPAQDLVSSARSFGFQV